MFTKALLVAILLHFVSVCNSGPLPRKRDTSTETFQNLPPPSNLRHSRIKRTAKQSCVDPTKTKYTTDQHRKPYNINYIQCKTDPDCVAFKSDIAVVYSNGTATTENIILKCLYKPEKPAEKVVINFNQQRVPQYLFSTMCLIGTTRFTKVPVSRLKNGVMKITYDNIGVGCNIACKS